MPNRTLRRETLLSLKEASKKLPKRISYSTIKRWAYSGLRGIVLETALSGGRRYTSLEALDRFLDRIEELDE